MNEIFSGRWREVYETDDGEDQKGIHDDSVGFGPDSSSRFEAGRTCTLPDRDRQMTLSPLIAT